MPRLESVARVSPWPKPIVPWWTRLPSAATSRAATTIAIRARGRRATRPATRAQRFAPGRLAAPAAGQKARSPSTASSAGRRVKAEASITAIPIARIGPSQWVDSRLATRRTSIAAITVAPEAAIAGTDSASAAGNARAAGRPRPSSSR